MQNKLSECLKQRQQNLKHENEPYLSTTSCIVPVAIRQLTTHQSARVFRNISYIGTRISICLTQKPPGTVGPIPLQYIMAGSSGCPFWVSASAHLL